MRHGKSPRVWSVTSVETVWSLAISGQQTAEVDTASAPNQRNDPTSQLLRDHQGRRVLLLFGRYQSATNSAPGLQRPQITQSFIIHLSFFLRQ